MILAEALFIARSQYCRRKSWSTFVQTICEAKSVKLKQEAVFTYEFVCSKIIALNEGSVNNKNSSGI